MVYKKKKRPHGIITYSGWGFFSRYVSTALARLALFSFIMIQQAARHVDRAVQSVGITLRKTKPKGRAVESGMRQGDRLGHFGIDSG
jgi:hypothetical protein